MSSVISDPWEGLRQFTAARIALGHTGHSLPTDALLAFQSDHAQARDAVYSSLNKEQLIPELQPLVQTCICLTSQAQNRQQYLQRPDWGRKLSAVSKQKLIERNTTENDLSIVIADGLSASAINQHVVPLLSLLIPVLVDKGWTLAPVCLVEQGRVAIADEIGFLQKSKITLILIGERPGLSSPDSMGAYLTFQPKPGLTDESRNCISNIRPAGLHYPLAAEKIYYLLNQMKIKQISGVNLKDEMELPGGKLLD
ncbi:ethanolamine ammonia-lyase subunit EutC [Cytophagaceae bacterium DM2B3-1]|uniref:Ethanolamine ammonia-lyase small subunit n=1 Tax=Xanthocytophaga flava TaxID=3048013 RepID=A0ABT7CSS9_9BACT|nr:ethanolamine ammonia-lyase subunit EutC [Xanthocytophaga flavus]MDJ1470879.1 ethanolamine ammonia-lyase subunit EutC [Xanthocytophaga flavus]MDJ1496040.1 ethanolamine ammonia-lyase subunit EutC [Xanthocytophaga flavus]